MTASRARFAWVLNLDAEYELTGANYNPPTRVLSQLSQYGTPARALLGSEDRLIMEGSPLPDSAGLIGRAWCPTPQALEKMRVASIEPEPHPTLDVLRRVNHRRFAFELGGGLEGQCYVESRHELERLLQGMQDPWLLKRPLSFAGRGQQRVYTYAAITEKEWSWIDASLRKDGLLVEPLVEPSLELSVHGFVWRSGHFELGRPCVQEVSKRGAFQSVRLVRTGELSELESRTLSARAHEVAAALSEVGYFGPFGMDAYRYAKGSHAGFCTLSEINARYTMGFVTGFPRHPSELLLQE